LRKEKFQVVKRAVTLVLLAMLVCCVHIKADIWPLVLVGDPIPNTPNFRFIDFGQAVVNTSGTIAFHASFVDPSTNATGDGIFKIQGGQLFPVMMEGQPVPDVSGASFGSSRGPSINSAGDIVFVAFTNERLNQSFQGIFEQSGGILHRVVDYATPIPSVNGENFSSFSPPQINDQGQIAFGAGVSGGAVSGGLFLLTTAGLQAVALNVLGSDQIVDNGNFALNNHGDIALSINKTIFVWSAGVRTSVATFPLTVPGTNYQAVGTAEAPSLNDDDNVVFIAAAFSSGRGPLPSQYAVVRWRNGTLEKIVAEGDPVPGFNGATFDQHFLNAQVNQAATIFTSRTSQFNQIGFLARATQDGHLSVLATENQFVDGIGTLDFIASPNFDPQQGNLVTFFSTAAARTETGIYATTVAPQYTLRFPQIADGGGGNAPGAAGGWRTTFVLANRSTFSATATISFFDDTGAPLSLAVGGMQQTQTTVNVPALGVAQVQTQGGGPLKVGWALAQSDQNLTGIGIYGLLDDSSNTLSEVGVPASLALLSMSLFAETGATTSTGIALANPNSTAATVTLILRDANSSELSRIAVGIPAMGHLARYANELFTGIPPGEFKGKIDVISTQPLAGLTLRQQGGSVFTSLPVIP
jgi:hypothetical protein